MHHDPLAALNAYLQAEGLQVVDDKEIPYGRQFKITDGTETCLLNIYGSGKVVVQGKSSALKERLQGWGNLQSASANRMSHDQEGARVVDNLSRSTKYVVAPSRYDKLRAIIEQLPGQVVWHDATAPHEVFKADVRADGLRVVLTQFKTNTLFVQGRQSPLFDQVCTQLDAALVQAPAEHATRYLSDEQAAQLKPQMDRPEAEAEAWRWLESELMGRDVLDYLFEHDRNTLIAGAVLLQAAENLPMPDYSPLVMPFARAYEGFLIQLFISLGMIERNRLETEDISAIKVGAWLNSLPDLLKNPQRDGHIVPDLRTAWEGTRHLMIHSDPTRQTVIPNYAKAKNEICGVLIRAMTRGYEGFVEGTIPVKTPSADSAAGGGKMARNQGQKTEKEAATKLETRLHVMDEAELVRQIGAAGYNLETIKDHGRAEKWRVVGDGFTAVMLRMPGDQLIVRGKKQETFLRWYEATLGVAGGQTIAPKEQAAYTSHIGADEAGKGDYFGPLVVAAVFVDESTAQELVRLGVRDSKTRSDSVVMELAAEVRRRCPFQVETLMPAEYNNAYKEHQNLNVLLGMQHAKSIRALARQTGCMDVLVDQFAPSPVMESALDVPASGIRLSQRSKAEGDIAVAAASILARAAFVEAIEEFRAKSGLIIPFGASAPEVVSVAREIVRRWGEPGLARIAKVNFKTTREVLGTL